MNVVGGDGEGSGDSSGSGSGSSGNGNEIETGEVTVSPTTDNNSVEEEDNMLGGGVSDQGGNTLGKRDGKSSGQNLTTMNTLLATMLALAFVSLRWC